MCGTRVVGIILLLPLLILLSGCGSGGSTATNVAVMTGRATLTIRWPESSRLVPVASQSIRVTIVKGSSLLAERLLTRPASGDTSSADFDRLPVGDATFRAAALPNPDGSGVAQAAAVMLVPIVAGQTASVHLTMASTIDRLEIMPTSPATIVLGQTLLLTATAWNTAGETVLTQSSTLEWSSNNTAVATVAADGRVTGISLGSADIAVREKESGKTTSVTVNVANQSFSINGKTYVPSGTPETLTATFTQPDGGVTIGAFSGYVLLNVTGTGQAYGTVFNDAFYVYTNPPFSTPQNGHDGGFYQLAYGTTTLQEFSLASNAKNFLVGGVPAYNPAHEYMVILDTKTASSARLHFGVTDGGYGDNTGAYTITVTQLVPAP